jgi:flagellar basal body rod protein FlgC
MGTICVTETSVINYEPARPNISEEQGYSRVANVELIQETAL